MKDSKKEHRISDLKEMINNVTDEEDFEEDRELINYLNENHVECYKPVVLMRHLHVYLHAQNVSTPGEHTIKRFSYERF